MAVSNTVIKNIYILNKSTTTFSYTFDISNSTDIHLFLYNTNASVETEITSGFTVDTTAKTVTWNDAVNYDNTYKLTLSRETILTQLLTLINGGSFFAEDIMAALDKLTYITQEQAEALNRSVKVQISDITSPDELMAKLNEEASNAKTSETNAKTSETNSEISNQSAKRWAESESSPDETVDSDSPTGETMSSKLWAILARNYAQVMNLPEIIKNVTTDDVSKMLRLNQNGAWYITQEVVNVKDFGAVGDGVTDDSIAIQNAINYGKKQGLTIFIPNGSGSYLITQTLVIPSGVRITGSNAPQLFTGIATTKLVFKFASDSMDAAIRIDDVGSTSYDTSLAGNISSVHMKNLTLYSDSSNVCLTAILLRGYGCSFENITISGFRIGMWLGHSYMNDFKNVHTFLCQMGWIANLGADENSNCLYHCWAEYATGKENETVDSRIQSINSLLPTLPCSFIGLYGGLHMDSCYAEGVSYGIWCYQGHFSINHIGIEAISSSGALFYAKTGSAVNRLSKIIAKDIYAYSHPNNADYAAKIAECGYGTVCILDFRLSRSENDVANLTAPSVDTGTYIIMDFLNGDNYVVPISVVNDKSAFTNAVISNNRSHFTRRNTFVLDCVLTYDSYNSSYLCCLSAANSIFVISTTLFTDSRGGAYKIGNTLNSLWITDYANNYAAPASGSRIYVEIPLATTNIIHP